MIDADTSIINNTCRIFVHFFLMPKHLFYLKIIWLRDNTANRNIKRHRAHWAVLVLGCIWLFVLHTTWMNRVFRCVFRFVSDISSISDHICIACTETAFFIKKQKALGDFQIIFQLSVASFVPDLSSFPWILACGHKTGYWHIDIKASRWKNNKKSTKQYVCRSTSTQWNGTI